MQLVTADLYDAFHEHLQVCELSFKSFGRRDSFCGPCATLETFEDHGPVLEALQMPGEGRILVVDGGGSLKVGVLGDRLAAIAAQNGWVGVIVVGAIRDSRGIDDLDIGVKALGTTARRTWSLGKGRNQIQLEFGSVSVRPGMWVYADRDCVLFSKGEEDVSKVKSSQ